MVAPVPALELPVYNMHRTMILSAAGLRLYRLPTVPRLLSQRSTSWAVSFPRFPLMDDTPHISFFITVGVYCPVFRLIRSVLGIAVDRCVLPVRCASGEEINKTASTRPCKAPSLTWFAFVKPVPELPFIAHAVFPSGGQITCGSPQSSHGLSFHVVF